MHKLSLDRPRRYSEDIDLVQTEAGPVGPLFDGLRAALSPWLGDPKRKTGPGVATLTYRVAAESDPSRNLRLKIEINTREHFACLGFVTKRFAVKSRWHSAECDVRTYSPAELLGTKLRALYQRRKGRDLFDLWLGLNAGLADPAAVVDCFRYYLEQEGIHVTQSEFLANLDAKLSHHGFLGDLTPLVPTDLQYDVQTAAALVRTVLVSRL